MNFLNRKLARSIPSYSQLVKLNNDEFALNTFIPFKTHQQRFVPGQEIEQETIDGRKVKNIFTIEGNTLTERQIEPNREVIITREFSANEMKGTSQVGKVISFTSNDLVEE